MLNVINNFCKLFIRNIFIRILKFLFYAERDSKKPPLCIKSKFNASYKNIEDEKFYEVLKYIEF